MITPLLFCQFDSIVTNLCGTAIPAIQRNYEAGTNCEDVAIAQIICNAVVAIVLIGVLGFLAWTLMKLHAQKNVTERKRKWDNEDMDRIIKADEKNRANMLEDENRKRENSLLDQKLNLLRELCDAKKSEVKKETKETKNSKKCEGERTCELQEETKEENETTKFESVLKESTNEDIKKYLDALEKAIEQITT